MTIALGGLGGVVSKCEVERDDHSMCTGLNRTGNPMECGSGKLSIMETD